MRTKPIRAADCRPSPVRRRPLRRYLSVGLALALAGCAATTPEPDVEPTAQGDDSARPRPTDEPTALVFESEVGALDRAAVQDNFAAAVPQLQQCVKQGRKQRQPLIGGAIEPVLRIDNKGHVIWSYLRESTLGDHATEQCILETLSAREWPLPSGGKEGETSQQMDLGVPDEREPVAWSADDVGPGLPRFLGKVAECRRRADTGPMTVTLFVDPTPDGRAGTVVNAGVAVSDEKGANAVDCAVKALLRTRVRSPGSYTARVTLRID